MRLSSNMQNAVAWLMALAVILALAAVFLAGLHGAFWLIHDAECKSQWKDSGIPYRHPYPLGGCQVKPHGEGWIPSAAYRKVD